MGRTGRAGDKEGVAWTLLDKKKDTHFAGLLENSLSLSGQEVPQQLHELAMKVGDVRDVTAHWRWELDQFSQTSLESGVGAQVVALGS